MNPKKLIQIWLGIVALALLVVGCLVVYVDPYFHYHKPFTDKFYYELNNERSQNDGIIRHFDYDALITGTSMTENFKTSEMDAIFGTNSVKVAYQGGTFKETNECIARALESNPNLKIVVRGLDRSMFFDQASRMRTDLGEFPDYLYDNNPFNDLKYIFNKDVLFGRILPMILARGNGDFTPGITSFDSYANWQFDSYTFGAQTVCSETEITGIAGEPVHITEEEKIRIEENIRTNITDLANAYPEVDFYYFITPYGATWWAEQFQDGTIYANIEAEELIISLILQCPNIHLYSFNGRTDITTDLNQYKDVNHYGQWINSLILRWMHDDEYRLTRDNYESYIAEELKFYTEFDYTSLLGQPDYESDFYAAALLNEELTGAVPVDVLENSILQLSSAEIVTEDDTVNVDDVADVEDTSDGDHTAKEDNASKVLKCIGNLSRDSHDESSYADYLLGSEYIGGKMMLENADDYGYVTFYGRKSSGQGQPLVYVYNEQGEKVREVSENADELDEEWHQYVIDITDLKGNITIIFNGGGADNTYAPDSEYCYKDIVIY